MPTLAPYVIVSITSESGATGINASSYKHYIRSWASITGELIVLLTSPPEGGGSSTLQCSQCVCVCVSVCMSVCYSSNGRCVYLTSETKVLTESARRNELN